MSSSFLSVLNMSTTAPTSESVIPVVVSSTVPRSCAVCHTTGHDKRNCPSKPSATAATEPVTAPMPSVSTEASPTDWLMRVGDGVSFIASSKFNIWGIKSLSSDGMFFLKEVKPGDRLWFVKANTKPSGQLIRVATVVSTQKRELGPLISLTYTNEELGWDKDGYDTMIHYKDLYDVEHCKLYSEIISPKVARKYNEKCKVNLPLEYPYIVRYSKARKL